MVICRYNFRQQELGNEINDICVHRNSGSFFSYNHYNAIAEIQSNEGQKTDTARNNCFSMLGLRHRINIFWYRTLYGIGSIYCYCRSNNCNHSSIYRKDDRGHVTRGAEATLIESQNDSYNSVFAGCDSVEKREDGYHYELTVIWTSGEGYEQHNNYRHGTMHLTSNEDYLIQGRVYYLNTEALAARGLFKEECLREGGLDITGINPGAFTDGGTVGATVMNLALRAYEGPQSETEARTINNVRNGRNVFIGISFILMSIVALIISLINNSTFDNAFNRAEDISKKSSGSVRAQVISREASDNPDYTKLKLDYSYNGEKYESSFDVSTENLYAYSDTVYVTVKNDNPAKITSISTTGNKSLKSFKSMRNMGKIFEYVICGIFFVVGITLAVKGFRAKGN